MLGSTLACRPERDAYGKSGPRDGSNADHAHRRGRNDFFPVPREHLYGATVHLLPGLADTLTAEIVHCRIDYQRTHLYRLGTITQPHQLTDNQLRDARDLHLLALQVDSGRADFGEPLKGRT